MRGNEEGEEYFFNVERPPRSLTQDSYSEVGSDATSVAATVADSAFREELDEYFMDGDDTGLDVEAHHEHNGDDEQERVELEGRGDVRQGNDNGPGAPEEQGGDLGEEQDGLNEDDMDGVLEGAFLLLSFDIRINNP